jgi:hypothetical protein
VPGVEAPCRRTWRGAPGTRRDRALGGGIPSPGGPASGGRLFHVKRIRRSATTAKRRPARWSRRIALGGG